MASAPMKTVVRFGHATHPIDRKKYGQPRLALFWAGPRHRFTHPGLYLWTGKRNVRILPLRSAS